MKVILDKSDYSFDPANRKIYLSDRFSNYPIERIGLITNVTAGVIIYQFNDPAAGATMSGTELTLDYDTSAMAASDDLQVICDLPEPSKDPQRFQMQKTLADILVVAEEIRDILIQIK